MPEQPPKEPPGKPEPVIPREEDRHEWACRYCSDVFCSAQDVASHQARVHRGVGWQRVTDIDE